MTEKQKHAYELAKRTYIKPGTVSGTLIEIIDDLTAQIESLIAGQLTLQTVAVKAEAERDAAIEDFRIPMLQYQNLRKCFHQLTELVLGKDYYNTAMDVYTCDEQCCADIWNRTRSVFSKKEWRGIQNRKDWEAK